MTETSRPVKAGRCRKCGREKPVRADGMIREHITWETASEGPRGPRRVSVKCDGANQPPAADKNSGPPPV